MSKKLENVVLHADAYATCMLHAFSIEKEEIMGLLVGEVIEGTSHILSCIILHRSDKTQDRVEISDAQLTDGMSFAEKLKDTLKRDIRIVGWYHSHPHITVWPSHVDTQTQLNYQLLDKQFVGLIFSVYSYDTRHKINKVEMTCFQASQHNNKILSREVPVRIQPGPLTVHNLKVVANLPFVLNQEYENVYQKHKEHHGDLLVEYHNEVIRQVQTLHLVSRISWPIYEDLLVERLKITNIRIQQLKLFKEQLIQTHTELQNGSENVEDDEKSLKKTEEIQS